MADRAGPDLRGRGKPAAGLVPLFLVFTFLSLIIFPASSNVITYDGKGNTGSIQDLINTTSSGDSIYLTGGIYHENILINRPIVFGALDSNSPPEIISSGASGAGITLAADGITINGVIISGTAGQGLLVLSNNNRISAITIKGFPTGISLKSAIGNIFSGNTIANNSVGIGVDRSSRSNIFYLNYLDNPRNVDTQSIDNVWSGRQNYQYQGTDFSGPLGNFWKVYNGTDNNSDGIGDTPYVIQSSVPGQITLTEITDRAPLVGPPGSYTLVGSSGLFNTSPLDGGLQPPEFPSSVPLGANGPLSGPSTAASGNPFGPQNPFLPFLAQYWWVIPIALIISVIAGIWFERRWKRREPVVADEHAGAGIISRNATIVKKGVPSGESEGPDQFHYAARLPPALERKYPTAEYVAEGGVSRVFRAWDDKEGRDVAVKIPIRFDEITGTLFTKELHIWEGLHHRNIVEIYAANIFPVPYIEMEYVESSLRALTFPLEIKKAVSIIRSVAEGLRYAHEQGIVHRDIKPDNIMIAPDGTPKISDWGLSKAEGTKQSGLIGFSLEYAAPEQLAPNIYGEPGPWTDIYQLGVLFYEMLTGNVPFGGAGMGEVTHAILHNEPLPPELDGEDAGVIRGIILRCLAKKPKDRYRSVTELMDELKKVRS
jgi:eukaryotic-like serine/threonine-protein kinase